MVRKSAVPLGPIPGIAIGDQVHGAGEGSTSQLLTDWIEGECPNPDSAESANRLLRSVKFA